MGTRRETEQTAKNRADRVLPLTDAKIQDQSAMDGEALRLGETTHRFDKPGLADPSLAAHINELSSPPVQAGADDPLELIELRSAPDEGAAAWWRRFARDATQAPDARGRFD